MKRAFTLIELLVYIAILGFIIVVAGRVFSDSTVMRVRSQSMVKTSEEVGKVSSLIREDLSQMGAKAWGQDAGGSYTVSNVGPKIYWSASSTGGDSSSYALVHRPTGSTPPTFYDSIVFRKADFSADRRFIGIREISWAANSSTRKLVRRCKTIEKCTVAPCGVGPDDKVCEDETAIVMAENVTNFNIVPSKPGLAGNAQDTLFGASSIDPNFKLLSKNIGDKIVEITSISTGGTETTVANFAQNLGSENKLHNELYLAKPTGSAWSDCEELTFKKGETYVIEFGMPLSSNFANDDAETSSTQFVPGRDHLAVGLRTKTGAAIPASDGAPSDILFYPAQSSDATGLKRHMEFSVSKDIEKACIAITMAYYPPSTSTAEGKYSGSKGKLRFTNFKVFRKADETFHFLKPGEADYEENYGTELMTPPEKRIKQKTNAKAFELILEIENRGEKSGTYSSNGKGMVITTPNNGVTPQN